MAKKPNIRFVGFEDDWEQRKLGATNTFFTDGNYGEAYPKLSDMTDSGSGVPFLTGGNLKDGKLSLDGASYITPEKHSKLTSGHLLEDDIVIAVRGSLGALGYVNTDNSGWNINSQLAILRTDKSELYGKFLIQYLLSWTGQNELLKRQTGSALKQLPIGAIKDVEVPITSIAEQEKIGEYFADLDNLITLHQRKCDELKKVKKFMLQKMFPKKGEKNPEIRFDGFTNDWEQRKLGEMATETYGGGTPKTSNEEFWKGDIPWIQSSDLIDECLFDVRPRKCISQEAVSKSATKLVPQNSIAIVTRVGVGKLAFMPFSYATSQDFLSLSGLKIDPKFTVYALYKMMQSVSNEVQGTSIKGVTKDELLAKKIIFPSCNEQKKIGAYLHNLDHLITLHQCKCKSCKKYYKCTRKLK